MPQVVRRSLRCPIHANDAKGRPRTLLTVLENVAVGVAARRIRVRSSGIQAEARSVLDFLDIGAVADLLARTLPCGTQRRVEIARALAADPVYLLLDEPAAGMNEQESDELLRTLRSMKEQVGPGILVVDHDLRLIMRLCERIYVLNQGRCISHGSPDQVQQDSAVIVAYLGRREAADDS